MGSPALLTQPRRIAPATENFRSPDVEDVIDRAQRNLLDQQMSDGHWVGELQGDTILESEYILLMAFLGRENDERIRLAANYLLQHQQDEGGWSNYPDGPPDISVSVKAYFALKIAGHTSDEPLMQRAANVIRSIGGAEATNSFTRYYLALLGQFPWSNCPTVPPEMVLLPRWFYVNIYAMSAWSRTIFVPLSIVSAKKPVSDLPESMNIRELFLEPADKLRSPCEPKGFLSWTNFFLRIDGMMKFCERWNLLPFRRWAVRKALRWMKEHSENSDGIGAIFPPMVYHLIVLHTLGVDENDPEYVSAMKQIDDLIIREDDTVRLQPCLSPVWDTALTTIALADSGISGESLSLSNAIEWLLAREIRQPGDWSRTNPNLEPGGWCFEYNNAFYPDTDDTSMVLIAIAHAKRNTDHECRGPIYRALQWLVGMQNRDGGWAAFDRNIDRQLLEKVPFADHNAMLDPSCPDITARVLESLGHYGYRPGQKPVTRALAFLMKTQKPDGSWKGRWGVNYVYGTWQVLVGLQGIGFDMNHDSVKRAVSWLKSVQNSDAGWGESCRSYDDPSFAGKGPSTASQTAWALLGLLAAGEVTSSAVKMGVEYLTRTQNEQGGWDEAPFTGTGFPKVFYLKYHMYPQYFPLMALARFQREMQFVA